MARKPRDYSAENARRNERARAAGFRSYREQRDARRREAGKPARDYRREEDAAYELARKEGFANQYERRAYQRARRIAERRPVMGTPYNRGPLKRQSLKLAGLTEEEFERMRAASSRHRDYWGNKNWRRLNQYDEDLGDNDQDWSRERVFYVRDFYRAIVDRPTAYDSWSKVRGKVGPGHPIYDAQRDYFERVGFMTADEFDARYAPK